MNTFGQILLIECALMSGVTTKAIVLSTIKYGDTSLIVKCFTEQEGVKTYLIKGVLTSRKGKFKPSYFQPLTQIQVTTSSFSKGTLYTLKEAQVIHPYVSVYTSVVKQTILMFLSEVLSGIIQEEEKNLALYTYIETALVWLDTHTEVANFHLLFLLNLSRFLGFYPDVSDRSKPLFSLIDGCFKDKAYEREVLFGNELLLFKSMLGINFDTINTISYNKRERQIILQIIIQYFELHLEGFRKPKSLTVLETVFS